MSPGKLQDQALERSDHHAGGGVGLDLGSDLAICWPRSILDDRDADRGEALDHAGVGGRAVQRLGQALDADAAHVEPALIAQAFAIELDQQHQALHRVLLAPGQGVEEHLALVAVVGQGDDDVVLGGEVEVERALADAGLAHDVGGGGGVEAVARETAQRPVQYLLAAFFALGLGDLGHGEPIKLTGQSF